MKYKYYIWENKWVDLYKCNDYITRIYEHGKWGIIGYTDNLWLQSNKPREISEKCMYNVTFRREPRSHWS